MNQVDMVFLQLKFERIEDHQLESKSQTSEMKHTSWIKRHEHNI